MSALAAGPAGCPSWCAGHSIDHEFDGSVQVIHQRPVVVSDELHADIQWYEDLRAPEDPERFDEPPVLVLNDELCVPITPETLAQLETALGAARLVLTQDAPQSSRGGYSARRSAPQEGAAELVQRLGRDDETARLTPYVLSCVRQQMISRRLTTHDVAWNLGVAPGWVEQQLHAEHLAVGSLTLLCIGLDLQLHVLIDAAESAWRRDQLRLVERREE